METLHSHAKINLGLSLFGKREDGFHNLETVMHEIDLCDVIHIEKSSLEKDRIRVEGDEIEGENLIEKALKALRAVCAECPYFDVQLKKKIPMGAGLGGGSSNAIVVLKYASRFCEDCSRESLDKIAASLGSDTNFFLSGGTALCKGRGEQIEQLEDKQFFFNLILPKIHCATPKVFGQCLVSNYRAMDMSDLWSKGQMPGNDLMEPCFRAYPEMKEFYQIVNEAVRELYLSGSGSTFFTLHSTPEARTDTFELLSRLLERRDVEIVKAKSFYRS